MNKYRFITVLLWFAAFILGQPKISATVYTGASAEETILAEESDMNFISFEVNVSEEGHYYAEFWLMPAQYPDGSYTRFSVYVNDGFAGNITPSKGNWQSIRIEESEAINLKRGTNIIRIGAPAPEIPAVETIRVARKDTDAVISSHAYDSYYAMACEGRSYDIPEQIEYSTQTTYTTQSSNAPEVSMKHFSDVPLKYTFHSKFTFKKGQKVRISTSSSSEHDLDMVYLGYDHRLEADSTTLKSDLPPHIEDVIGSTYSDSDYHTDNTYIGIVKPKPLFIPATPEEMQGLNWKGCSYKSSYQDKNIISKTIDIPISGIYLIRLRHRESGKTGIANISVVINHSLNKDNIYLNVPISFTWVPCELPANGSEYGTLAKCSNPSEDNSMLFIHGAAADRVVGYNDDAPLRERLMFELSGFDSHILQKYNVRTSGISINSCSSNAPESSCYIIAGMDESEFEPDPEWGLKPKWNGAADSLGLEQQVFGVNISNPLEQSDVVTVTSQSPIHSITISDTNGSVITAIQQPGMELSVSRESLHLPKPGVYIISVETDNGIASKKLLFD